MSLDLDFWKSVATAWDRTLTEADRAAVHARASHAVEQTAQELKKLGTKKKIRNAKDLLADPDADLEW